MAKQNSLELLQAATKTGIPIRRNPGPLPPGSLLYRRPKKNGPALADDLTKNIPEFEHGQHIYVYNNIRTNQIVYSLTRHLNNTEAMRQLPFLGKKTVPEKLRKDLWRPFCLATFPSPHAGLLAYRKLREFRRLHETAYPRSAVADPKNPGANLSKREKGKALMNQKANSVADLAAVLLQQERGPRQWRLQKYEMVKKRWDRLVKMGAKKTRNKEGPLDIATEFKGVDGVKVYWSNISDAEFAETWPKEVVHSNLARHRYTAAWPAYEDIQASSMEEDAVEEEEDDKEDKATDEQKEQEERPAPSPGFGLGILRNFVKKRVSFS